MRSPARLVRASLGRLRGLGINGMARRLLHIEISPYADMLTDLAAVLGPDSTVVIDVGAYNGDTALELATTFPRATIHALEPATAAYQHLRRLRSARIRPYNIALGREPTTLELNLLSSPTSNSLLSPTLEGLQLLPGRLTAANTEPVNVIRLDDLCSTHAISHVDLLKLDTQGTELDVLSGGVQTLKHTRAVLVEVNFVPQYTGSATFADVAQYLVNNGFRFHNIYNLYRDWHTAQVIFADALFLHL